MRALLLPVKDLKNAKKRLANVLTPEERFGLAQAMLADTLRAIQRVRGSARDFAITNYQPVMDIAEEYRWGKPATSTSFWRRNAAPLVWLSSRPATERGPTPFFARPQRCFLRNSER